MPLDGTTIVELPTFHPGQVAAWRKPGRFKAIRCGRRWGKTVFGETVACDAAIKGRSVGFFAPSYKVLTETYGDIADILEPVKSTGSRVDGVFRTKSGGRVDYWSLEDERAGRSRKYHGVIVDEGAFTKANMMKIWERAIRPTLIDYRGWALVLSNTNGVADDNFFWQICNQEKHGFVDFHAPAHANPFLPVEELNELARKMHPLVYRQEVLAEFIDWSGVAFFALDRLLEDGAPVPRKQRYEAVFATIDTATKTGKHRDGTGLILWGIVKVPKPRLVILDWDVIQIEGALLETWLPTVFQRLEALSKELGARAGSLGAFVEDKSSGMVLLQQAARRKWPATPIDSKLTALGKDERAISVSGYHYQGLVKICPEAYDKTMTYKENTRNHLLAQVGGFRVGVDGDEDDLLDAYCYGLAIALGDGEGF